jgi:hypothetical protein
MRKCQLQLLIAALIVLAQPLLAQNVKLAKIALGMTETEVKTALTTSAPIYIHQSSDSSDLRYLVAETEIESYAFALIDEKVAGFSVVHILPPGQLPFLDPGQQPTVSILRGLITKQTWAPSVINRGDTYWFSDTNGAPLADASQCRANSGEAWLPFGPIPSVKPDDPSVKSTAGLMKPSAASYPLNCGVSIHLNLSPGETEDSVVTTVKYQVLDIKAMNALLAKHHQR